jgi:hypothetical protein
LREVNSSKDWVRSGSFYSPSESIFFSYYVYIKELTSIYIFCKLGSFCIISANYTF